MPESVKVEDLRPGDTFTLEVNVTQVTITGEGVIISVALPNANEPHALGAVIDNVTRPEA